MNYAFISLCLHFELCSFLFTFRLIECKCSIWHCLHLNYAWILFHLNRVWDRQKELIKWIFGRKKSHLLWLSISFENIRRRFINVHKRSSCRQRNVRPKLTKCLKCHLHMHVSAWVWQTQLIFYWKTVTQFRFHIVEWVIEIFQRIKSIERHNLSIEPQIKLPFIRYKSEKMI